MFGISRSVRSREVQVCTPELFHRAIKGSKVSLICAEIEDALEKLRRGELKKEEYERMKTQLKSQLPILTPHATFKNGRRLNADAIPSGLSIYDKDHIPNPRGYWEEKQKILAQKSVLDSICLVHVTPSTEGLRLIFKIPKGMTLAEAQKWMSEQLEDNDYDSCVKDLARPSFLVPEDYILYIDEAKLFEVANTSLNIKEGSASESEYIKEGGASESEYIKEGGASESEDIKEGSASESEDLKQGGLHRTNNRNSVALNNKGEGFDAPPTLERSGSERRVGAVSPSPLRGEGRGERWSPPYEGGTGVVEKNFGNAVSSRIQWHSLCHARHEARGIAGRRTPARFAQHLHFHSRLLPPLHLRRQRRLGEVGDPHLRRGTEASLHHRGERLR